MNTAMHTFGSTRALVWFSRLSRKGPGLNVRVSFGAYPWLITIERFRRSWVGSPCASMNCAEWVTASKTMTNSGGS